MNEKEILIFFPAEFENQSRNWPLINQWLNNRGLRGSWCNVHKDGVWELCVVWDRQWDYSPSFASTHRNRSLYKATIYRHGANDESIYGNNPERLAVRAEKLLNQKLWTTIPIKAVIFLHGSVSNNWTSQWEPVKTILPKYN